MSFASQILVATDFGEISLRALAAAFEIAAKNGGVVNVVHAFTLAEVSESGLNAAEKLSEDQARSRAQLEATLAPFRSQARVGEARVVVGDPVHSVTRTAEELKCDLIVIGTHGRHGLKRALLGSVAEAVVRGAGCAVLVVK
jgi:universal stress protein A